MESKKVIRLKDRYPEIKKIIDKMWDKCEDVSEIYWQKLLEDITDNKIITPIYKFIKPIPNKPKKLNE